MNVARSSAIKKAIKANKILIVCLECGETVNGKQGWPQHLKCCCGLSCAQYAEKHKTEEWTSCSICGEMFYKPLKTQNKTKTCGKKECVLKSKNIEFEKSCLASFGVTNPLKSKEIRDKIKNTNLEKRGVEFSSQDPEVKKQTRETCIRKFGAPSYWASDIGKETIAKTNLDRYGTKNVFSSSIIKEKINQTNNERYGCDNPQQNEKIRKKTAQTNINRYGAENVWASEIIKEKIKRTHVSKRGVTSAMQDESVARKVFENKNNTSRSKEEKEFYEYLINIFGKEDLQHTKKYVTENNVVFFIDIYISSIDTYIQFDSFWHGLRGIPIDNFYRPKIKAAIKKDSILNEEASKGKLNLLRIDDKEFCLAVKQKRDPVFYKYFFKDKEQDETI